MERGAGAAGHIFVDGAVAMGEDGPMGYFPIAFPQEGVNKLLRRADAGG